MVFVIQFLKVCVLNSQLTIGMNVSDDGGLSLDVAQSPPLPNNNWD